MQPNAMANKLITFSAVQKRLAPISKILDEAVSKCEFARRDDEGQFAPSHAVRNTAIATGTGVAGLGGLVARGHYAIKGGMNQSRVAAGLDKMPGWDLAGIRERLVAGGKALPGDAKAGYGAAKRAYVSGKAVVGSRYVAAKGMTSNLLRRAGLAIAGAGRAIR